MGEKSATKNGSAETLNLHDLLLPVEVTAPSGAQWKKLEVFDQTITREEFQRIMEGLYDPFDGMDGYLKVSPWSVILFEKKGYKGNELLFLRFAPSQDHAVAVPNFFRTPLEIANLPKRKDKPLDGLRVVIDPADIGGKWGPIEDRSVYFKGYGRIQEGDLNLVNGLLLKERLVELGAEVRLIRTEAEPLLDEDSEVIVREARKRIQANEALPLAYLQRVKNLPRNSPRRVQILAEILMTKTYETRARAHYATDDFAPDITLVLQHNATSSSSESKLASMNRNVFFVPGAYTPDEVKDPRQRYQLLEHLLQRSESVEASVASSIARAFQKSTGHPPVLYGDSKTTRIVSDENPYVYARNLAVTREHTGPVVIIEPYFMNEKVTLQRLLEGDYEGTRLVAGKRRGSIFREYVNAVVEGLIDVYRIP